MSLRRKLMLEWLRGPGEAFKRPRSDIQSYLGGFDRFGKSRITGETVEDLKARASQLQMQKQRNIQLISRGLENQIPPKDDVETSKSKNQGKFVGDGPKMPFPLNPFFKSEAVLSKELRDEIYRRVVVEGQTVREASVALRVSMERVAAVVRLKTVELDWQRQNKLQYQNYEDTVMGMLPKTEWSKKKNTNPAHESINDLPVHHSTQPQIWWPTSESRHFTRVDAGKVFHEKLLPADQRIPHPEMIEEARDLAAGYRPREVASRLKKRFADIEAKKQEKEKKQRENEARHTVVVEGGRWDFKFKDVYVEAAGKDGRSRKAFASRYGAPHEDRKPGQIKIPTKVE